MTMECRKEVFVFKNKISSSTLITDQKKVANYLKTKGLNHEYKDKYYVEISETKGKLENMLKLIRISKGNIPIYCYQDIGKKKYLYFNIMTFDKEDWDLVKLLGYVANEKPEEDSIPIYQVGEKPFQFFDEEKAPKNSTLIGYLYMKNRIGVDYLSYDSSKSKESFEQKTENEENEGERDDNELSKFGGINRKEDPDHIFAKEVLKNNKIPCIEDLRKLEELSKHNSNTDLIAKLCVDAFLGVINDWVDWYYENPSTRRKLDSKQLLFVIGILNNISFQESSISYLLKNNLFLSVVIRPLGIKKKVKLDAVFKSVLVLLQTLTRSRTFLDLLSNHKSVNFTGTVLDFVVQERVLKNYRFCVLGFSILRNCCAHKILVNTIVLRRNIFLENIKYHEKKVVFVRVCLAALFNISKIHNDLLEHETQILKIVELVKNFGCTDEGVAFFGLSLLRTISIFRKDHGIDFSFLEEFKAEYSFKKEILDLIGLLTMKK